MRDFANNINNSDVLHLVPLVIRSFQRPRMTRGARTRGRAPAAAQSAAAHRRPARIAWPRWDAAPVRAAPNDTLLVSGPDGRATDAAVIGRPAHGSITSVASASPAAGYGVTAAKVAVLAALVSCEVTARPARAVLSMAIHTVEWGIGTQATPSVEVKARYALPRRSARRKTRAPGATGLPTVRASSPATER